MLHRIVSGDHRRSPAQDYAGRHGSGRGFRQLAYPSQPPAQFFGPGIPAVAFGRTDYPGSIAVPPPLSRRLALKAFVHYLPAPYCSPNVGRLGWGVCRKAKKSSAKVWSLTLAGAKLKLVMTPSGLTASSKWKPSYQPKRLLQPMSACPASQPAPRRLADLVGTPELSKAS